LDIGDSIDVCLKSPDGSSVEKTCMVSGIYSDVTNGGKTAKASFNPEMDITPVMWSIVYVTLNDESLVQDWTEKFRNAHGSVKESMKVTSIKEYLDGVYGQTISNIGNASVVTSVFVMLVLFVVILLLLRLLIWRERSDSSLKKALGFTSRDVQNEYLKNVFLVFAIGIVVGILAGVFPGQLLAGIFLSSLGAQGFRFIINPVQVFVLVPVISLFTVLVAAWAGLIEIRSIRAFECLR
jgi:putative ABC transport system permease protein